MKYTRKQKLSSKEKIDLPDSPILDKKINIKLPIDRAG